MFSHIALAHEIWKAHIHPGDSAIDATCGRGRDSLVLAKLALSQGKGALFCFDIQEEAIEATKVLLSRDLDTNQMEKVYLIHGSHAELAKKIQKESIHLVVYNLGYLPRGNKSFTTMVNTTLESVDQALSLLKPQGMLSITCYPGHEEGLLEERALEAWLKTLSTKQFSINQYKRSDRHHAPSLIIVRKADLLRDSAITMM